MVQCPWVQLTCGGPGFFAAAVPAANILRLGLLGLGITKNEAVVKAVSREGNPRCSAHL